MGCDIHLYREKKIDGAYVTADEWADEYDEGHMSVPYKKQAYTGRNYDLFGFLSAGVRREIPGAFEPRGIPDDACAEVAATVDQWGVDGHSHSWLSLRELSDAAERLKTATAPVSGMMRREQLAQLHASIDAGAPDWSLLYPHCQAIFGEGAAQYTNFKVQVPVSVTFGDCLQRIIDSFAGIDGTDHRIVFFFDN